MFLSKQWIEAAKNLQKKYKNQLPDAPLKTQINVIIQNIDHRTPDTLLGHIDTSTNTTVVEEGHLESPELTITLSYEIARAAFVDQDQQKIMEAFIGGKILVEGDVSKLIALQSNAQTENPTLQKFYGELSALTE